MRCGNVTHEGAERMGVDQRLQDAQLTLFEPLREVHPVPYGAAADPVSQALPRAYRASTSGPLSPGMSLLTS